MLCYAQLQDDRTMIEEEEIRKMPSSGEYEEKLTRLEKKNIMRFSESCWNCRKYDDGTSQRRASQRKNLKVENS